MAASSETRPTGDCSHDGCLAKMTPGAAVSAVIPPGWTHVMVETYGKTAVTYYHLYFCPQHILTSCEKQASLF